MSKKYNPKEKLSDSLSEKREYNPFVDQQQDDYPGFLDGVHNALVQEANDQRTKEDIADLIQLVRDYGISDDDPQKWLKLSLLLAQDYIPGFQYEKGKPGNGLIWTDWKKGKLYVYVNTQAVLTEKTPRKICLDLDIHKDLKDLCFDKEYKPDGRQIYDVFIKESQRIDKMIKEKDANQANSNKDNLENPAEDLESVVKKALRDSFWPNH